MKQKLLVILGPTATGKTALAIELARALDGEVVSADSRQIYRGLDLGTGKATKREMRGVPHHLLDVASPKRQFSAAEYAVLAREAIAGIAARGKLPIVCGGTGFYIDALLGLSLPDVQPNEALRKKLAQKTAPALFAMLEKLDPQRAKAMDPNNKVRIIRSIEIAQSLGRVPALSRTDSPYQTLTLGLDMPDATLRERIARRLDVRLKHGMLKEAERLHAAGLSWKRMRELGLEYRSMAEYLTKKTDRTAFVHSILTESWRYAKRQRRWFRRNTDVIWLDPNAKTSAKKAEALAKKFLKS